jgi:hypothetical protein
MTQMTGWEIDDRAGDLLRAGDTTSLTAFCTAYGPLAALSADGATFAVLRRYHPSLNCSPDDETNPSDDFSMRIGLYTATMQTFFFVPKHLTYISLALTAAAQPSQPVPDYVIETAEFGTTRTNNHELRTRMAPDYTPVSDTVMREAFASFTNARPAPITRIPITSTSITLPTVGTLHRSDFDDWFSMTRDVPLLGKAMPITVADFHPDDPAQARRLGLFDTALSSFLTLTSADRATASRRVLQNCHEYIDAVGEDEWNAAMAAISNPEEIWTFVYPRDVSVAYDDDTRRVYVSIACECEWEQEHGLQLVYRDGSTLTRVSAQDGHYAD